MSDVLILSAIVMLVLLFLKVPVYIAVLGGSMVYFVLNPDINAVVFAQQAIIGTEKISLMGHPVLYLCRYLHELYRRHKADHGLL